MANKPLEEEYEQALDNLTRWLDVRRRAYEADEERPGTVTPLDWDGIAFDLSKAREKVEVLRSRLIDSQP